MTSETDQIIGLALLRQDLEHHKTENQAWQKLVTQDIREMRRDIRSLLEWRWKLVGALGVIVFAATWFAGWIR